MNSSSDLGYDKNDNDNDGNYELYKGFSAFSTCSECDTEVFVPMPNSCMPCPRCGSLSRPIKQRLQMQQKLQGTEDEIMNDMVAEALDMRLKN
jgi:hypothetical protein